MARAGRQPKKRSRGSVLTKLLILVILAAIGLQLRSLHSQVQDAQAQRDALTAQVQAQEQENAALAADIAEGATEDKMKEIRAGRAGADLPQISVCFRGQLNRSGRRGSERPPACAGSRSFLIRPASTGAGKTIRKEKQYTIWSFR